MKAWVTLTQPSGETMTQGQVHPCHLHSLGGAKLSVARSEVRWWLGLVGLIGAVKGVAAPPEPSLVKSTPCAHYSQGWNCGILSPGLTNDRSLPF